jgi:hypothetical protein
MTSLPLDAQRQSRQIGRARAMLAESFFRYLGRAIETVTVMALFLILAAFALYLRARLGFIL